MNKNVTGNGGSIMVSVLVLVVLVVMTEVVALKLFRQ